MSGGTIVLALIVAAYVGSITFFVYGALWLGRVGGAPGHLVLVALPLPVLELTREQIVRGPCPDCGAAEESFHADGCATRRARLRTFGDVSLTQYFHASIHSAGFQ